MERKLRRSRRGLKDSLASRSTRSWNAKEAELAIVDEPRIFQSQRLRPGSGRVFVGWHELRRTVNSKASTMAPA